MGPSLPANAEGRRSEEALSRVRPRVVLPELTFHIRQFVYRTGAPCVSLFELPRAPGLFPPLGCHAREELLSTIHIDRRE